MDQAEAQRRWTAATEFAQAAETADRQQQYRACVGLASYACFACGFGASLLLAGGNISG
jgi:hypothetical protein